MSLERRIITAGTLSIPLRLLRQVGRRSILLFETFDLETDYFWRSVRCTTLSSQFWFTMVDGQFGKQSNAGCKTHRSIFKYASHLTVCQLLPGSLQLLFARSVDFELPLVRTHQPDQPFTCTMICFGNPFGFITTLINVFAS